MADIVEDLVLRIDEALAAVDRVERRITDLSQPVRVSVDDSGVRALSARFDDVTVSAARLSSETREADRAAGAVASEMGRVESSASAAAGDAARLSRELDEGAADARVMASEMGRVSSGVSSATTGARRLDAVTGSAAASTSGLGAAAVTTGGALAGFAGRVGVAVGALGGFGVLRAVTSQLGQSLTAFNDLSESVNAVNVTYEAGAEAIAEFGATSAASFGIARSELNTLAVPIGALLRNFGLSATEAADSTVILARRAADLGSVLNRPVADALTAIGAGLRGQSEPLLAFGANINEARVAAEAMALGLASSTSAVSDQAKIQARLSLILKDTAFAAGDFANTIDGLPNRTKTASAGFEEMRVKLGEGLVPAMEALLGVAPAIVTVVESMGPAIADTAQGFATFVAAVDNAAEGGGRLEEIGQALVSTFGLFTDIGGAASDVLSGAFAAAEGDLAGLNEQGAQFSQKVFGNQFVRVARQNIVQTMNDGTDAVTAFANAMAFLARQRTLAGESLPIDAFDQLAQAAGLSSDQVTEATFFLARHADQASLTTFQVNELNRGLASAAESARLSGLAVAAGLDEQAAAQARLDAALSGTSGFAGLIAEAAETGLTLTELAKTAETAGTSILAGLGPTDAARARLALFAEDAATAARSYGDTVDIFKGKVDEHAGSTTEFVKNLREAVGQQQQFEADLTVLAARGLGRLADELRSQGPAAAAAANDFVADTFNARQAEDLLSGYVSGLTEQITTDLTTELGKIDLSQLGSEAFLSFLAGFNSASVNKATQDAARLKAERLDMYIRKGLEFGSPSKVMLRIGEDAGDSLLVGFNAAANRPVLALTGVQAVPVGAAAVPGGQTAGTGGGNVNQTINITNPTVRDLESETARLAQLTGAVASTLRGF